MVIINRSFFDYEKGTKLWLVLSPTNVVQCAFKTKGPCAKFLINDNRLVQATVNEIGNFEIDSKDYTNAG